MADAQPYTHGHHESVLRSHRWRTAANSAAYLLPVLAPGLSLLDVGCGPGTITADLARRVAPGQVLGIDREEAPLLEARAGAEGLTNVRFARGDLFALEVAPGSFDVVHTHQVLQHLVDPVAALIELRLVCRPGGVVAARDGDYASMTWFPHDPLLDRWQDLYQRVARANGGEPDAGRQTAGVGTRRRLRGRAGLGEFMVLCDTGGARLVGGSLGRPGNAVAFAEQALGEGHATRADLEAIAAASPALGRASPMRGSRRSTARYCAPRPGVMRQRPGPADDRHGDRAEKPYQTRFTPMRTPALPTRTGGVGGAAGMRRHELLEAALADVHGDDGPHGDGGRRPRRPAGDRRSVRLERCPSSTTITCRLTVHRRLDHAERQPSSPASSARTCYWYAAPARAAAAHSCGLRSARVGLTDSGRPER